jgi:predicted NAD-dependent protein-ADP-ribosyltransferase YbiA (DUF1768 family)
MTGEPLMFHKNHWPELSNLYPFNIFPLATRRRVMGTFRLVIRGVHYKSTEHYFQSEKFARGPGTTNKSYEFAAIIRSTNTANKAASLAQQPTNFWRMASKVNPGVDDRTIESVARKYTREDAPMRTDWDTHSICVMKVALLCKFRHRELVEASKTDLGIGPGYNYLGREVLTASRTRSC